MYPSNFERQPMAFLPAPSCCLRSILRQIIWLIRIFTDGEINVAVKSGRLCRTDDRYIDTEGHARMDDLLREFLTETSESLENTLAA
jgi:hypothetical protein